VGDTLRRIVGKALLHTTDVKAQLACLQARQCGVGVPYACEMVRMGVLRKAVGDFVGCGRTHGAWERATIPISKGGLGVRDPERCWVAAMVDAIIHFHAKASKLVDLPAAIATCPVPDTPQVLSHLSGILGPQHDPISQWVLSPSSLAIYLMPSKLDGRGRWQRHGGRACHGWGRPGTTYAWPTKKTL